MKSYKEYNIHELSYREKDIPKFFRAVIDIDKTDVNIHGASAKNISELKRGVLKGVKGISDTGAIAFDFLGVGRNAMLLMKAKDVVKLNGLSRFMYDNPHYFFSNNMDALRRMYQKPKNDNRGLWHNLADKVFKEMEKHNYVTKYDLSANAPGQSVSYTDVVKRSKVNSIKDAVKVMKRAMVEVIKTKEKSGWGNPYRYFDDILAMKDSKFNSIFNDAVKDIGSIYKDEGEWVVKGDSLIVPKGSFLYVLINYIDLIDKYKAGDLDGYEKLRYEDKIKEEVAFMRLMEKEVGNKYRIKFVSTKRWEEVKEKYRTKKYNFS